MLTAPLAGCVLLTDFVVVNASDVKIQVSYRVKEAPGATDPLQMLPIRPATKSAADLDEDVQWHQLGTSEFSFDVGTRTVSTSLNGGDALRIEQRNLVDGPQNDYDRAQNFAIEEIELKGVYGDIRLQGDLARRSFVVKSRKTYVLAYDYKSP